MEINHRGDIRVGTDQLVCGLVRVDRSRWRCIVKNFFVGKILSELITEDFGFDVWILGRRLTPNVNQSCE